MILPKKKAAIVIAALATSAGIALYATSCFGQNLAAGPFNAAQVSAGHNAYVANCMVCHGDTMSGAGEAPAIAGKGFMVSLATRPPRNCSTPSRPKCLWRGRQPVDDTYNNLVAFLLHASGAATGTPR